MKTRVYLTLIAPYGDNKSCKQDNLKESSRLEKNSLLDRRRTVLWRLRGESLDKRFHCLAK